MKRINPYYSVWLKTKITVDYVLSVDSTFLYFLPIIIGGFSTSLGKVTYPTYTDESLITETLQFSELIMDIVFLVLLYSILWIFVIPWLLLISGRIIDGSGTFSGLQRIMGVANIARILPIPFQIIRISTGEMVGPEEVHYIVQILTWFFYWKFLLIGIAKVQKFSYGFAIVNIAIVFLPLIFLYIWMRS